MTDTGMTDTTLIVLVGLPGAGKSSWARRRLRDVEPGSVVRLNRDTLRVMLHDNTQDRLTESQVLAVEQAAARVLLLRPEVRFVIIDDTNLRPTTLEGWRTLARSVEASFRVRTYLHVPLDTCIVRDRLRPRPVGEMVIRDMHDQWIEAARRWVCNDYGWSPEQVTASD
jgi:predicted kinase